MIKNLICKVFGHREVAGLFEDHEVITHKGCSRCGAAMMHRGCIWKGMRFCVPPWMERKEYEKYIDEREAEFRKEKS